MSAPNAGLAVLRTRLPRAPLAALLLVGVASTGLLSWVDVPLYAWLRSRAPGLEVVPDLRLTSLAVCAALFASTRPEGALRLPREVPWRGLATLYGAWLVPTAFFIFVARGWVPSLPRTQDVIAFMVTGLLAEELLFRGALFQLAERTLQAVRVGRLPAAVLVSALFFSVSHLQYHGFQLTPAALAQVGYTLPMGIAFALPRAMTRSLWPGILLHALTNVLALSRGWS